MTYPVRWFTKEDVPAAVRLAPATGWEEADFYRYLGKSSAGIMAACSPDSKRLLGYLAFVTTPAANVIRQVVVDTRHRRRYVGATLVYRLGLIKGRRARPALLAPVRESDLATQLFFKTLGFTCHKILRRLHQDPEEDAYLFRWEVKKA